MAQETEHDGAGAPGSPADEGTHGGDAGEENGEPAYMAVWGGLAALTLAEVWVASAGWARTLVIVLLVGMAVWKALLVALYYMHLKFEPRRLWILAAGPLPLAVILVVAVLQEF